ncbi:MAG: 4-hydroxy-tetrahydrodipicolinate synthase [Candidatus Cloacimonas sp. 4484_275]|nr:MAG: 4-hydroxy-tetrahydrodipicolinate synthase [Candidatus Cloacimonas sp. 4484_275]RLC49235.1 MAG: 4-hydroxy-tetrahydrodipicolinate synthase [Candidatus Cloacimonadota bacterium]
MQTMKNGAYTLLITPFKEDMSLDEEGLRILIRRQLQAEIDGIAPLGVTGENTLLTEDEIEKFMKIMAEEAKGKTKIVPDTCTMSLWKAIERVKMFADLGADYVSVYSPFFVLPKTDGVIKYYEKLADASPIPIILHNAQARTGINLEPETTALLAKHPNIVGIKDGNKKLDHLAKVIYLTQNEDFAVFTGKDTTAFPLVCFGGSGSFTVAGNVIPEVMKNMIKFALEGKIEEARKLHNEYYELFEAFRFETNPMGAKKALNLLNLPAGSLRLPLTELSEKKTEILRKIMHEKGLL